MCSCCNIIWTLQWIFEKAMKIESWFIFLYTLHVDNESFSYYISTLKIRLSQRLLEKLHNEIMLKENLLWWKFIRNHCSDLVKVRACFSVIFSFYRRDRRWNGIRVAAVVLLPPYHSWPGTGCLLFTCIDIFVLAQEAKEVLPGPWNISRRNCFISVLRLMQSYMLFLLIGKQLPAYKNVGGQLFLREWTSGCAFWSCAVLRQHRPRYDWRHDVSIDIIPHNLWKAAILDYIGAWELTARNKQTFCNVMCALSINLGSCLCKQWNLSFQIACGDAK